MSKSPLRKSKSGHRDGGIDLGPLLDYIGFHLRVAQDASFRAMVKKSGSRMRPGVFAAMTVIANNPGIGQGALGRAIGRDKSTITPLIQNLQREGLIDRHSTPGDRRRINLHLTAEGKSFLDKLARHARAHDRHLDEIVGDRKPEFIALLKKIAGALG